MKEEPGKHPTSRNQPVAAVLIIGGGISGMQSALDLANSGMKVYLVEQAPAIGGRMAQLDKTFPTNDCAMCIVSPKLVEVGRHKNITLFTHSEVERVDGKAGNFSITISRHARYVDLEKCTGCGLCEQVCPVTHLSWFPVPADETATPGKRPETKNRQVLKSEHPIKPTALHRWTFSIDIDKCKACGSCYRVCLQQAIHWEKGKKASILKEKCTSCGACYAACPEKFQAVIIDNAPELDRGTGAAVHARSQLLKDSLTERATDDCICCGLCVIICKKVMGIGALKMVAEGIEASLDKCQVCGACITTCPVNFLSLENVSSKQPRPLLNGFNQGLSLRKPINIHYPQAVPRVPVIDAASCVQLNTGYCGTCATVCGTGAISYKDRETEETVAAGSVIFSPGIEVFDATKRGEYGYSLYPNVLTSLEFERLLSASGPTSGVVSRPSDGKHPKKIAWIQCVGSRDYSCDRDYCSSVCCMYAAKEAFIAREHDREIRPTIFYIDMRSFGKNFDDYIERAKDNEVRFVRAMVSRIFEDPSSQDLELRYFDESGKPIREIFNMVVLSVGIQIPEKTKQLAAKLRISLDRFGFAETGGFTPLASSRPGIYVSGAVNGPKDIPETVSEASAAAQVASASLATVRHSLITADETPAKRETSPGDELRIGVFICHCGSNIASVIDVAAITEYARTLPGVVYAEHPLYTCSQDTQERIRNIIEQQQLNRVVAAACSPTTHEPLFMSTLQQAGINKYFFDMANIRDQCSWVHPDKPELATEKAKRLMRMAVASAASEEPLDEMEFEVTPSLLVIGGGLAGLTAAIEAAEQGFSVSLVEKARRLGGRLYGPQQTWHGESIRDELHRRIQQIEKNPAIKVFTNAEVIEQNGFIGSFETDIMTPSGAVRTIRHGCTIVATGAEEYRPELYELGHDDRVMTQTDVEQLLAANDDRLNVSSVLMLQCAGSRCDSHLPYCSRICCNQAVKNALRLRDAFPSMRIDILYRDMRCYGLGELHYRKARLAGVNFIRYDKENNRPQMSIEENAITVSLTDPSIALPVRLIPNLLVLSTGMVPTDTEELASMLKVPRNRHGFFIEAHAKLRPVDLPSEGLFMAGTAHGPKDTSETITQAQAAVARATTILSQKTLRLSGMVSTVDPTNCAACLTCVRACPYGVPFINENHAAEINPALCRGCGICVAECPAKTISLGRFEDKNIMAKLAGFRQQQPAAKQGVSQ